MQVSTPMGDALGKYLDLTADQMKLTAGNMANIDTPGYKTQGFDFEEAFGDALRAPTHRDGTAMNGAPERRIESLRICSSGPSPLPVAEQPPLSSADASGTAAVSDTG